VGREREREKSGGVVEPARNGNRKKQKETERERERERERAIKRRETANGPPVLVELGPKPALGPSPSRASPATPAASI